MDWGKWQTEIHGPADKHEQNKTLCLQFVGSSLLYYCSQVHVLLLRTPVLKINSCHATRNVLYM